ncbi:3-hydroxyacyl-CoA dehydrogenase NAD-binding domain-containing protein [Cytobacillus horneckiae]|uniref:3-hydroxyacyl-CoA dehydrogenase family protein n=1 Tax=Cytobacillus horneckiae TaxID=549687 RepID=UPI0039A27383
MRKITVIGAGTMGRGIALVCAQAGFHVIVQDIHQESLQKCKQYIDRFLETGSIEYTANLEDAVGSADLVIEAILEVIDLKKEIFKKIDQIAPREAILATNTSTMSPTEIASVTSRPDKCIALHFFNPVHKMKLIEVICGLETSEETIESAFAFGEKIGKECVKINEFPGFATSRMNCLIGNEAMFMVMEGVGSVEDIDRAMKLGLNHPMGPLELADLVGLDSRLRNMEYLHKTLGEKFRPCPILQKYVSAGWTGKKSGRGFYQYDERGNKR